MVIVVKELFIAVVVVKHIIVANIVVIGSSSCF